MPKNLFDVNVNSAKNWSDRSFLNRKEHGFSPLKGQGILVISAKNRSRNILILITESSF